MSVSKVWRCCRLKSFGSKPVLAIFRSFGLLWHWGVLCCVVCIGVRASPTRMRPAERRRPLSTETVWQQTLFVQIHLRVGTAHLTAHRDKLHWDTQPLFVSLTPIKTGKRKAVNITSSHTPTYRQNTQATHVERCWQPTQVKMTFENTETSPLLVVTITQLLNLNKTRQHLLTTDGSQEKWKSWWFIVQKSAGFEKQDRKVTQSTAEWLDYEHPRWDRSRVIMLTRYSENLTSDLSP